MNRFSIWVAIWDTIYTLFVTLSLIFLVVVVTGVGVEMGEVGEGITVVTSGIVGGIV